MHGRTIDYGVFILPVYHADGLRDGGFVLSGYLLTVIGTVLRSSILTAIVPEGKTASLIKSVARLACVVAIIAPILRFFQTGSVGTLMQNSEVFFSETGIESEESFIQYYSEWRVHESENSLKKELESLFTEVESVTLTWSLEEEFFSGSAIKNIKILQIQVQLNEQSNEEATQDMWEYLTKNYCSEVLIE